jgi:hypothetical protein
MYVLLIVVCPFLLFPLAIVLSVPLQYTDFDYSFGIFKLFSDTTPGKFTTEEKIKQHKYLERDIVL